MDATKKQRSRTLLATITLVSVACALPAAHAAEPTAQPSIKAGRATAKPLSRETWHVHDFLADTAEKWAAEARQKADIARRDRQTNQKLQVDTPRQDAKDAAEAIRIGARSLQSAAANNPLLKGPVGGALSTISRASEAKDGWDQHRKRFDRDQRKIDAVFRSNELAREANRLERIAERYRLDAAESRRMVHDGKQAQILSEKANALRDAKPTKPTKPTKPKRKPDNKAKREHEPLINLRDYKPDFKDAIHYDPIIAERAKIG